MHSCNRQSYEKGEWNYPKVHLIRHLFEDIVAKGVTKNFTTKTFEKMHGPAKDSYKRRTNFKNVAIQVLVFSCSHRCY